VEDVARASYITFIRDPRAEKSSKIYDLQCESRAAVFAYRCRQSSMASQAGEEGTGLPLVTASADRFTRFLRAIAARVVSIIPARRARGSRRACRRFKSATALRCCGYAVTRLRPTRFSRCEKQPQPEKRQFAGDAPKVSPRRAIARVRCIVRCRVEEGRLSKILSSLGRLKGGTQAEAVRVSLVTRICDNRAEAHPP